MKFFKSSINLGRSEDIPGEGLKSKVIENKPFDKDKMDEILKIKAIVEECKKGLQPTDYYRNSVKDIETLLEKVNELEYEIVLLKADVKRLKEYEFMYKDLCK